MTLCTKATSMHFVLAMHLAQHFGNVNVPVSYCALHEMCVCSCTDNMQWNYDNLCHITEYYVPVLFLKLSI